MAEEIKEKIRAFLKDHKGEEFSILKLRRSINLFSYPTILKWVTVLVAEEDSDIIAKDYGNIKLVSYVGE